MSGSISRNFPNVCIYAVVDVSGSMQGSKLQSVCSSIHDMFSTWPDSVLFDLTLFSTNAQKIVTALKSKIDIQEIVNKIQTSCGGSTALYDAWGDMLISIPESVFTKEEVQIFVLTDGDDNMSRRYTLSDVLELTKQRVFNRAQFTLIEVGDVSRQLIQAINAIGNSQIQTLSVDNNALGIKTALQTVNKNILTTIRSTQSAKSSSTKNRLPTAPPSYGSSGTMTTIKKSSTTSVAQTSSQHPMMTTIKKTTTPVGHTSAHSSTNTAANLLTTSKKIAYSSGTNQSSRSCDANVSYTLK